MGSLSGGSRGAEHGCHRHPDEMKSAMMGDALGSGMTSLLWAQGSDATEALRAMLGAIGGRHIAALCHGCAIGKALGCSAVCRHINGMYPAFHRAKGIG
jgi:hypothetical protein